MFDKVAFMVSASNLGKSFQLIFPQGLVRGKATRMFP